MNRYITLLMITALGLLSSSSGCDSPSSRALKPDLSELQAFEQEQAKVWAEAAEQSKGDADF